MAPPPGGGNRGRAFGTGHNVPAAQGRMNPGPSAAKQTAMAALKADLDAQLRLKLERQQREADAEREKDLQDHFRDNKASFFQVLWMHLEQVIQELTQINFSYTQMSNLIKINLMNI